MRILVTGANGFVRRADKTVIGDIDGATDWTAFFFISTIKVNVDGRDAAYRETDAAAPEDAYAMSK